MSRLWLVWLSFGVVFHPPVGFAHDFQITRLDPAGELMFRGIPRATGYRLEWSAEPGSGPWRQEGLGVTEFPVGGAGERTVKFSPRSAPCFYRVVATLGPEGFVFIPGGTFQMGDSFREGSSDEFPVHSVTVSTFYLQAREATKAQWDDVLTWAVGNGYFFNDWANAKATNHPAHSVSWFDVVKWCNARSEMEGRVPCYYTDAAHATVYRTGEIDLTNDHVLWTANGYRLPTEAEWEKAARGGLEGKRFPLGDTMTHSQANYWSVSTYPYDTSPTRGMHPLYAIGANPYTSAAGSFVPNGYGLYDMAGNVWEWCWDRHDGQYYGLTVAGDPRGPTSGSLRVLRGGSWDNNAYYSRVAVRAGFIPTVKVSRFGFRPALGR